MRTAVRASGFVTLLAVVLGAGWSAGTVMRPAFPGGALPFPIAGPQAGTPSDGPLLVPRTAELEPGRPGEYAFAVTGPTSPTTTARLTVVRRDATALQHATAVRGADGTWRASLTLPAPGPYRVMTDVGPGMPAADLLAPGPFDVVPFTPSRVAEVDGYQVRLDGDLVPGAAGQVFATVSRDGVPVTDLEPVDGGFGRLEAFHEGDLVPARVHPDATPSAPAARAGPGIAFTAEVPAAGAYRLFLDFRHGGALRTAVFTVPTGTRG